MYFVCVCLCLFVCVCLCVYLFVCVCVCVCMCKYITYAILYYNDGYHGVVVTFRYVPFQRNKRFSIQRDGLVFARWAEYCENSGIPVSYQLVLCIT